jgi:hypothetical protein
MTFNSRLLGTVRGEILFMRNLFFENPEIMLERNVRFTNKLQLISCNT